MPPCPVAPAQIPGTHPATLLGAFPCPVHTPATLQPPTDLGRVGTYGGKCWGIYGWWRCSAMQDLGLKDGGNVREVLGPCWGRVRGKTS